MPNTHSQAKILAQGIYEIRQLLSGFLGSENAGEPCVRRAAHLAYALHNEALAVIDGGTFDASKAGTRFGRWTGCLRRALQHDLSLMYPMTANKITAANAGERLGFAGRSRVGLSPRPGVAEFHR
jgi:hypothetical protein